MDRFPTIASLAVLALLAPLAACNRPDEGTSITINADGGNVTGAIDAGSGQMKVDVPGFKGSIQIPKIQLDAGNFELNGVHLYPGSTIDKIDIAGGTDAQDADGINLRFHGPGAADAVRGWYGERLAKVGYVLKTDGDSLVGSTDEGKRFRLDVTPDGPGRSRGVIVIGS